MSETGRLDGTQYDLDLPRGSTIKALRYLLDGRLLAVSTLKHVPWEELEGLANVVQVWDIGRATPLSEWVTAVDGWNRIAIHPDGSRIAISTRTDLSLWGVPSGQQLWEVRPATLANAIEFSPDGRLVATVGPYGLKDNLAFVDLRTADTGAELFSISPGIQSCDYVAFSPDATKLAVSGIHEDPSVGSLFVWTQDGRALVDKENEFGGQADLAFSPDGKFVVLSHGAIHVWDAESGDYVRAINASPEEGLGAAFFYPDGRTIVTDTVGLRSKNTDISDEEVLTMFTDMSILESVISRQVEMQKGESESLGEVVRVDFETGREWDRHSSHIRHPFVLSGYYGRAATLSPDGSQFAMALHSSIEVWRFAAIREVSSPH